MLWDEFFVLVAANDTKKSCVVHEIECLGLNLEEDFATDLCPANGVEDVFRLLTPGLAQVPLLK